MISNIKAAVHNDELVTIIHSQIVREGYPDHTQFDENDPHYDKYDNNTVLYCSLT